MSGAGQSIGEPPPLRRRSLIPPGVKRVIALVIGVVFFVCTPVLAQVAIDFVAPLYLSWGLNEDITPMVAFIVVAFGFCMVGWHGTFWLAMWCDS